MRNLISMMILALTACACRAQPAAAPAVVELFQSQGCSSCPPANAVLNDLADRKDLITLSFSVTYWDYLGWKDSFARPAYTQRQNDYARGMHKPNVYTPQMVINGRGAIVGTQKAQVETALRQYARADAQPAMALDDSGATVGGLAGGSATVWLVRYVPGNIDVAVRAGENSGRTLPHRHIVKQLIRLGEWTGTTAHYAVPASPEAGLAAAILLQQGVGGPIVGARAF